MADSLHNQRIHNTYRDILHLGNNNEGLLDTPEPIKTGGGQPLVLQVASGVLYLTPESTIDGGGNLLQDVILDGGSY